ncbi:MAG: hypothetical protein WB781_14940 [Candidatus Sulfotelmatobacter sp.]
MRSRVLLTILGLYLAFAVCGCSRKPSTDTSAGTANDASNPNSQTAADNNAAPAAPQEAPREREPLIVPARKEITVRLGSAIGSKLSQSGDTFTGSVAKDVLVGDGVAIPRGAQVSGTVVDAKALGRFKGGAVLEVRLDSIHVNGADLPVQAAARTFSEKGKGKRTAVMAGGGAVLGGLIGGLAGGGKGAAIGLAAGGGAGAGGAAFTGNKEIVLPAESTISFELTRSLEIRQ